MTTEIRRGRRSILKDENDGVALQGVDEGLNERAATTGRAAELRERNHGRKKADQHF